MSDRISRMQRLFTRFVPKSWAESMEADSRRWMVQCPNCGFERSVWDMGGIRWKAYGNSCWYRRCPNCGKTGWYRLYRKQET